MNTRLLLAITRNINDKGLYPATAAEVGDTAGHRPDFEPVPEPVPEYATVSRFVPETRRRDAEYIIQLQETRESRINRGLARCSFWLSTEARITDNGETLVPVSDGEEGFWLRLPIRMEPAPSAPVPDFITTEIALFHAYKEADMETYRAYL